MIKNIPTTYVKYGDKIRCTKCQSTAVKAIKTQPKKYPKPTQSSSGVKLEELMVFYNNGYSCSKCGGHFIAYFEADYPSKKPSFLVRFLKSIIKITIYLILMIGFLWLVFS